MREGRAESLAVASRQTLAPGRGAYGGDGVGVWKSRYGAGTGSPERHGRQGGHKRTVEKQRRLLLQNRECEEGWKNEKA